VSSRGGGIDGDPVAVAWTAATMRL
jgi:hypothetical protein